MPRPVIRLATLTSAAVLLALPAGAAAPPAVPPSPGPSSPSGTSAAVVAQPAKPAPLPPPAAIATVAAGGILGRTVIGPDGQEIGRVVDVLVDAAGRPRAAVIDFGGFLGVGVRRVAVDWSDLTFPPTGGKAEIRLDLTADQIKNAPPYTDQTKPAAVVQPPPARPEALSAPQTPR